MKTHPKNPASVYRPTTEREATRYHAEQFVRAMKAGVPADKWGRLYRALASRKLPRNYFTTARPLTLDEVQARMRARVADKLEERRLDHIRAEMRYGH